MNWKNTATVTPLKERQIEILKPCSQANWPHKGAD